MEVVAPVLGTVTVARSVAADRPDIASQLWAGRYLVDAARTAAAAPKVTKRIAAYPSWRAKPASHRE